MRPRAAARQAASCRTHGKRASTKAPLAAELRTAVIYANRVSAGITVALLGKSGVVRVGTRQRTVAILILAHVAAPNALVGILVDGRTAAEDATYLGACALHIPALRGPGKLSCSIDVLSGEFAPPASEWCA